MVAESGAPLLEPDAREALVALLPRATVVTPNLEEARACWTSPARTAADAEARPRRHALGARYVVVTGGHGDGDEAVDLFFDGERVVEIPVRATPGGARTARAALTRPRSRRSSRSASSRWKLRGGGQAIAAEAVRDALRDIGAGAGPVDVLGSPRAGAGRAAAPLA